MQSFSKTQLLLSRVLYKLFQSTEIWGLYLQQYFTHSDEHNDSLLYSENKEDVVENLKENRLTQMLLEF